MKTKLAHGLVLAFPAQGHIGPLTELCIKLTTGRLCKSHGDGDGDGDGDDDDDDDDGDAGIIRITFVNDHHTHNTLLQNQYVPHFRMVSFPDPVRKDGSTSGRDRIIETAMSMSTFLHPLEELVERLQQDSDDPITFILADVFTPVARNLAARFSLPLIAFWPQCAASLGSMIAGPKHGHQMTHLEDCVPHLSPLRWMDLSEHWQCANPNNPIHQYVIQCCELLDDATCIIINTSDELEKDYVEHIRETFQKDVFTIGPLLPDWCFNGHREEQIPSHNIGPSLWIEDRTCFQWLDLQPEKSVLYVSLGSVAILTIEQFTELALGLELCQQPILWVVRADLMNDKTPIGFPDGYLDRMRKHSCFVSWAPQKEVLFHKAIGGFLTHHGWNSTIESMAAGVPMLGWPYFADQMINRRLCADLWNVALKFDEPNEDLIGRQEVDKKVRLLMQSRSVTECGSSPVEKVRENIEQYKKFLHQGIRERGSSGLHFKQVLGKISRLSPIAPSRGKFT